MLVLGILDSKVVVFLGPDQKLEIEPELPEKRWFVLYLRWVKRPNDQQRKYQELDKSDSQFMI